MANSPYLGVIYELLDPRTGQCRYVGQTFALESRRKAHESMKSQRTNPALYSWKQELKAQGVAPDLRVVEDGICASRINERERFWCAQRSNAGSKLLNMPAGHIRRADLFGAQERAEIAVAVDELIELVHALRGRLDGRLPVRHPSHKHLLRGIDELTRAKWSIEV